MTGTGQNRSLRRLLPDIPSGAYPLNQCPAYRSSAQRAPVLAAIPIAHTVSEMGGPAEPAGAGLALIADLTHARAQGQRIVVHGRVSDEFGRPLAGTVIELWQANAAGRYRHDGDQHDAPLDEHFHGAGAVITNARGEYEFLTIEPGAYPWGNHYNAWRPRHIHFSLSGAGWAQRLVTQMYFPGDPTLALDPIFNAVNDPTARDRLVAQFDIERSVPDFALAYRFNVVLRGRYETPLESA